MYRNLDKALKGAEWITVPDWPHLEYPSKDHQAVRWRKEPIGKQGYPMWRCRGCKAWIDMKGSSGSWTRRTPCQNPICKAYFALRWPGGTL